MKEKDRPRRNKIPLARIKTAREEGLQGLTRWNSKLKPLQDGRTPDPNY